MSAAPRLVLGSRITSRISRRKCGTSGHPRYGKPRALAGRYLGPPAFAGRREWHIFEIYVGVEDAGAIILNRQDLEQMTIKRLVDDL
jgi:hypothetical protein